MSEVHEAVIGLEVHVQLATATKLFCGCAATFGAPPNTQVCPVCLGLPGALPVPNRRAFELAARAAAALGCRIHEHSVFARKNYFYPDLPKGYQITQFDRPLATGGGLGTARGAAEGAVRLRRIHIEEDAGKSLHDRLPGRSAIDLNRAGVPLIEIVTEPDLTSSEQSRAFLLRLKQILQYAEVSDCDMEKGSLRVDANVSIRARGSADLGTRTEIKNMNSFANVERALAFEIDRQQACVAAGDRVVHQTLLWDANRSEARPMRSKEESHDYRYFPDPDLPVVVLPLERIEQIRAALPELPAARAARFRERYGLPDYDADVLTADRAVADFFEDVAQRTGDAKASSNWVMTDVLAALKDGAFRVGEPPLGAGALAELITLVLRSTVSHSVARQVFTQMLASGSSAAEIVQAQGLAQVSDESQLSEWTRSVIADFPGEAQRWRDGDEKLFGFLMGQVMKRSKGKADPQRASELLRQALKS